MPFIRVIFKNCGTIDVPDADTAEWVFEREYTGGAGMTSNMKRLVCKQGERILAKFDGDVVCGFVWHDGKP